MSLPTRRKVPAERAPVSNFRRDGLVKFNVRNILGGVQPVPIITRQVVAIRKIFEFGDAEFVNRD